MVTEIWGDTERIFEPINDELINDILCKIMFLIRWEGK